MFSTRNCTDQKNWKSYSTRIFTHFHAIYGFDHVLIHTSKEHGTQNESEYFNLSLHDSPMHWSKVSFYKSIQKVLIFRFRNAWPKTSYLKALDIWVVLCYITVFMCSLEYCIVILLITKENEKLQIVAKKFEFISRILIPTYLTMYSLIFFIVCSAQ